MDNYILGIDTSAYTTSLCIVDFDTEEVILDSRKKLLVSKGQKGLRQQEAVFLHMKNFKDLFDEIYFDLNKIKIVSVSSKPRNVIDSYMPVFTVGQNYGKVISKTLNCNYIEYSHQENHIAAAMIDYYKSTKLDDEILAIHISGGTTEFLTLLKSKNGYATDIVAGTLDITFGQLIDRIGNLMEFEFPCGMHMEKYIYDNKKIDKIKIPPISKGKFINLSGMENYYTNMYLSNKYEKQTIINLLFEYISACIINIINNLKDEYIFTKIIITGGVISNRVIRNYIIDNLKDEFQLIFPSTANSSDNAIGNAYMPIIDRWYNEN